MALSDDVRILTASIAVMAFKSGGRLELKKSDYERLGGEVNIVVDENEDCIIFSLGSQGSEAVN